MALVQSSYDTYAGLIVLILLLAVMALAVWVGVLHYRLNRGLSRYGTLFAGAKGSDIQEMLEGYIKQQEADTERLNALSEFCLKLEGEFQYSLQRVGLIRFNPFEDTGGDQSFSLALLDNKGNGVVISSLYGRSQSRVYAKPIYEGKSKYALSVEEEQAIAMASLTR